jgi:hypothetical protein
MDDFTLPNVGARFKKPERKLSKGLFSNLLILVAHLFGLIKSILAGWLQHMPALPRLLFKVSNTHNF